MKMRIHSRIAIGQSQALLRKRLQLAYRLFKTSSTFSTNHYNQGKIKMNKGTAFWIRVIKFKIRLSKVWSWESQCLFKMKSSQVSSYSNKTKKRLLTGLIGLDFYLEIVCRISQHNKTIKGCIILEPGSKMTLNVKFVSRI